MLIMSSTLNLYKLLPYSCTQYFYISNHYNSLYIIKITKNKKLKIIQEDILLLWPQCLVKPAIRTDLCRQLGLVKVVLGQICNTNVLMRLHRWRQKVATAWGRHKIWWRESDWKASSTVNCKLLLDLTFPRSVLTAATRYVLFTKLVVVNRLHYSSTPIFTSSY